jgi:hypothetical protein
MFVSVATVNCELETEAVDTYFKKLFPCLTDLAGKLTAEL